jgi:hypothetical protein
VISRFNPSKLDHPHPRIDVAAIAGRGGAAQIMETVMPTYRLTRSALHEIALSVTGLFDKNTVFGEKAAANGILKVLVIRNPSGTGSPYISVRFPEDLLDRYDALKPSERGKFEERVFKALRERLPEYESLFKSGALAAHEAYLVEFDDRLFDGV